jgi:hypothetical protein
MTGLHHVSLEVKSNQRRLGMDWKRNTSEDLANPCIDIIGILRI